MIVDVENKRERYFESTLDGNSLASIIKKAIYRAQTNASMHSGAGRSRGAGGGGCAPPHFLKIFAFSQQKPVFSVKKRSSDRKNKFCTPPLFKIF